MLLVLQMVVCAAIAFAGGFWILSLWFDRRITGREGLLLLIGLVSLMFFAISQVFKGGPGVLFLFAGVFGAALLIRVLARRAERRLKAQFATDDIAKYREAIENHPDNPHAHSLLADVYRRLGRWKLAAEEYESAIELDSNLKQERYWLEKMRTEIERATEKKMRCPRCLTLRRDRERECLECGRLYSTIEIWRHALHIMEPSKKALVLGVAFGASAAAVAMLAMAPGTLKLASIGVFVLAPIVMLIISARMKHVAR